MGIKDELQKGLEAVANGWHAISGEVEKIAPELPELTMLGAKVLGAGLSPVAEGIIGTLVDVVQAFEGSHGPLTAPVVAPAPAPAETAPPAPQEPASEAPAPAQPSAPAEASTPA